MPTQGDTEKLDKELDMVKARMERTRRMVRAGAEDKHEGTALIWKTSGASQKSKPNYAQQAALSLCRPHA